MITIHDNFVRKTEIIDSLYQTIEAIGDLQLDFMPHSYVIKPKHKNELEARVAQIIRFICTEFPRFQGKGYEVWFNSLDENTNCLDHHVDCDEESEGVVPAKYTATFYLGAEVEGGELVIHTEGYHNNYAFISDIWEVMDLARKSSDWLCVNYKYNRLVLFESQFPHAVLPIRDCKGGKRVSLTISSWDNPIKVLKNV